jgi:hypothetical protein
MNLNVSENSSLFTVTEEIADFMGNYVEKMKRVGAKEIGLDERAGSVWISRSHIVTDNDRALRYYGGFEYVHDDNKTVLGNYVIYSYDDERVNDCIEHLRMQGLL